MKIIHQMSLKGPWGYRWKSPVSAIEQMGGPVEGQIKVPALWCDCFGHQVGVSVWSRRFQKPTNLDSNERVMIATMELEGVKGLSLNGRPLPLNDQPETGFRFDITEALEPSNLLEIDIECETEAQTDSRGMTEPAVIEIWSLTE